MSLKQRQEGVNLTHCPLEDVAVISKVYFFIVQNSTLGTRSKIAITWIHRTSLMISQN